MLHLVFHLGQERYAIEAKQVVEILPLVNVRITPHAPRGISGIIDYHGAPVPLIDLSEIALQTPSRRWMSTRIIMVDAGPLLGLLAENMTSTLQRKAEDFVKAPVAARNAPYLGPVTRDAHGIIQRIDLDGLLTAEIRQAILQEEGSVP